MLRLLNIYPTKTEMLRLLNIYPTKTETQHIELINSQEDEKKITLEEDHKQKTSLVYIASKVCQLLLHYTSFATRVKNVLKKIGHKLSGGQMVKSHKISVFIMLSLLD